jgi:hypothetical protein
MRGRILVTGASEFIGVAVCKERLSLDFDEHYFMYTEDMDICRRMHQRYTTIYFMGHRLSRVRKGFIS